MRLFLSLVAISIAGPLLAQRGSNDWMTDGFDGQRSSWVRNDTKINPQSMLKPGFAFVWKLPVENKPRAMNSLTTPSLIDFYISYRGFRTMGFLSGSANRVVAIDTDLGRVEWERTLSDHAPPEPTPGCPGGMTASAVRPLSSVLYPAPPTGGGFGRGSPAKSAVGEPREGAVTLRTAPRPAPPPPPAPVSAKPVAPTPSPFVPRILWVNALASDGRLHSMYVSNGEEPKPAVKFLPPNANAHGLVVFDNHAYVATSNGCGGVADGLWMMNLDTQKVDHWKASSSKVAGPAIGPDGTLYVSSGSELVALEPKTLRVKGKFSAGKVHFASMPVVFAWRDQDIVAAATNDGRLHILDAAKLDKPLASSRPFSSPDQEIKALATWVDPAGERWILAPAGGAVSLAGFRSTNGPVTDGAIVAWKVVDKAGAAGLEPGWVSPNMIAPKTPLIINGVVFALAAGKPNGPHATLYALDATTGKDVWSSGEAIHSFVSSGGLSAGSTRVYLSTHDGVQYAFGFPIETLD